MSHSLASGCRSADRVKYCITPQIKTCKKLSTTSGIYRHTIYVMHTTQPSEHSLVPRPRDGPTQVPRPRTTSRTSWSRDSPRSEPELDRDSMRFDSGLNLMEPELHNFAKTFLFWVDKLITHLDKIPYFTAVLVHTYIYLVIWPFIHRNFMQEIV